MMKRILCPAAPVKRMLFLLFLIYLSLFIPLKISYLYAQPPPQPDNTITLTTYYPAPFGAYKKMTISDSVGIGTTSPAAKLHVSAPTGPQSIYLTTENNDGTSGLALWFANNYADSFNKNWVGLGQDNTDNSLRFSTTGSGSFSDATMTITTNGSVGIGTAEPLSLLNVQGSSNRAMISQNSSDSATAPTTVNAANTYLHLGGREYKDDSYRLITFGWRNISLTHIPAYMGYIERSLVGLTKGDLVFGTRDVTTDTAPSERMRITAAGNVGIGTPGPKGLLHLHKADAGGTGSGEAIVFSRLDDGVNFRGAAIKHHYEAGPEDFLGFAARASGSTAPTAEADSQMVLTSTGNVGIGTMSPGYPLEVMRDGPVIPKGGGIGWPLSAGVAVRNRAKDLGTAILTHEPGGGVRQAGIISKDENTGASLRMGIQDNPLKENRAVLGLTNTNGSICIWNDETERCLHIAVDPSDVMTLPIPAIGATGNGSQLSVKANSFGVWDGSLNPRFFIDHDGRVGIGVITPEAKLDVNGTIRVRVSAAGASIASCTDAIGNLGACSSSRRFKDNIRPLENAMATLERLQGVSFRWKQDGVGDYGFIAEEVAKVIPEIVRFENNGTDAKTYSFNAITALSVEAIKEQQTQLDEQRTHIERLQKELEMLKDKAPK